MINPGGIPQIEGDLGAVAAHGQTLQTTGGDVTDTGADVHAAWQGLSGVYEAPEAGELLTAMVPVRSGAASAGAKVTGVGAALVTYAEEVAPIKAELASLQGQAQGFLNSVSGDDDWDKDGDKVDEHNQLLGAVSSAVAAWMEAQRRCANSITALVGGTVFVADNGDATQAANEFGYTTEQLAGAAASEQGLPWGSPAERDKPWYEDTWDGAYGFVVEGLVVDAVWGGLKDLGSLVGTQGWDQMKTSWAGLGTFAVALTPGWTLINEHTAIGPWEQGELGDTLTAAGKGLVAWDTWEDDPARAAGATTGNVLMAVLGTKGAGGAVRGAAAGAVATRAPRVAAIAAQVTTRVPTVRLPVLTGAGRVDVPDVRGLPDAPATRAPIPSRYADLPVRDLDSGQRGAWNSELHRPEPSTVYRVDDRHVYVTDDAGRVSHVDSTLQHTDKPDADARRNGYQQSVAGRVDRLEIDEGGHLVAASLGGPGEGINLVAMARELNASGRNNWNAMESDWRRALQADPNADIRVSIDVDYPAGSARPSRFFVEYSVGDGPPIRRRFAQ